MSKLRALAESLVTSVLTEMPDYHTPPYTDPAEPTHPNHEAHKALTALGFTFHTTGRTGYSYNHPSGIVGATTGDEGNKIDVDVRRPYKGGYETLGSIKGVSPHELASTVASLRPNQDEHGTVSTLDKLLHSHDFTKTSAVKDKSGHTTHTWSRDWGHHPGQTLSYTHTPTPTFTRSTTLKGGTDAILGHLSKHD